MNYILRQGDAQEMLRNLGDCVADAIITDPPYATTALAWDQPVDWARFWPEADRVLKPAGIVVMFSAQPFTTTLINSNRAAFRYELIWEKSTATGFLDANRRPLRAHENILVFARQMRRSTYNPQKTPGKPYRTKHRTRPKHYSAGPATDTVNETGDRHPRSVLFYSNARGKESLHPTQKPLDLMEWLVRTYTQPGDVVLDPFCGSGTTGVAAVTNQRLFIGCEREQAYYETSTRRLEAVPAAPSVRTLLKPERFDRVWGKSATVM